MTDNERELDLLVGDLQSELRQLQVALAQSRAEVKRLEAALESIHALSDVALWDSEPKGTSQVAQTQQATTNN